MAEADLSTMGEKPNMLDLVMSYGRGRSASMAACLGCELGLEVHVMAHEDTEDPRAIRVYARNKRDIESLESICRLAKLREGVEVYEETPRPGRRDLVIYAE